MEQHPIPQQISSYQFRLVGDMTLKQFFQLAGGALVSLLFYASNLPGLVKWPLIIFFALFGVALAFLPFEERPLEKWIVAFFRSIYTPTLFFWRKTQGVPNFFQDEAAVPPEKIVAPRGEAALNAYLTSSPRGSVIFAKLEEAEKGFLSKLGQLFGPSSQVGVAAQAPASVPGLAAPPPPQFIPSATLRPKIVVEERPTPTPAIHLPTTGVGQIVGTQSPLVSQAAQFSLEAAPPNPPTVPNTVVGQIVDEAGKIVEAAILEIRDSAGRPVRALRSNKLGHFMIVTPLLNGKYEIITEKEGLSFSPITFETYGEIIPPIAIRGKAVAKVVVAEQAVTSPMVGNPQ